MTTVFNVYLGGHAEVDVVPAIDDQKYIFVFTEGTCADFHCAVTDVEWFKEQCVPTTSEDYDCLARLEEELYGTADDAKKIVALYETFEPLLTEDIKTVTGSVEITNLIIAEDREAALDELLNLSLTIALLYNMDNFIHSVARRPFFDFLHWFTHRTIEAAQIKVQHLHDAMSRLYQQSMIQKAIYLQTPPVICTWPERRTYEPDFGVVELAALGREGPAGRHILDRLISWESIADAEKLIANRSGFTGLDALDAWLAQEEKSLKAARASKHTMTQKSKPGRKRFAKRALTILVH